MKRRAVIVDAPDLPPEEAEFFITSTGIADDEKTSVPESKGLDFEVETLYEENLEPPVNVDEGSEEISLVKVKGIGKGTVESLNKQGINSVSDLLSADPDDLSSNISGASKKMVSEWQNNAKALMNS